MANITTTCKITNSIIYKDGNVVYQGENNNMVDTCTGFFKQSSLKYPKYYKMDALCRTAFVGAMVSSANSLKEMNYDPYKVGIILNNSVSSISCDIDYYNTIKDKENFYPSPALFVYTLPNITIGEIAIYHKIKGHSAFFINKKPDVSFLHFYISDLFNRGMQACIYGWVNYISDESNSSLNIQEESSAHFLLIENKKDTNNNSFTIENFNKHFI